MPYDSIVLIVITVLAILGVLGGIPQMLKWMKPAPHLRINQATISKLPGDHYKYQIHLEIENESKSLQRNGDASSVTADYFVIDKKGVQCGATSNQMISSYLCAGTKILKDMEAYLSLIPEGNPYTIIFRTVSAEGNTAKKRIVYEANPIDYT